MIGIAITTTPERRKVFKHTHEQWNKFTPNEHILFVNNDKNHEGIPISKNKCLKYLYEAGCEHFFLADDDCYPLKAGWEMPYITHKEPHLMYQFKLPGKGVKDMQEIYRDNTVVAYTHTRGAMIYIRRIVLETVGGMDTDYGLGTFEHPDWTNRIHNAGLTTYRAMDVPNSNEWFYCLDQDNKVKSSITSIKRQNRLKNALLYRQNKHGKEYKEFR